MTEEEEVFKAITSQHKWYIGYCSQGYATQLVQRFEDGRLSEKTIEKMFNHFGYCVSTPKQWVKQSEVKPNKSLIDEIKDYLNKEDAKEQVILPSLTYREEMALKSDGFLIVNENGIIKIKKPVQLEGKPQKLKTK